MSGENLIIEDNVVVSMEYSLKIDKGREVSRADSTEPLEYIHGLGQIIPGLEKELSGMKIGDEKEVSLNPANGYGERRQEEIAEVSRESFPPHFEMTLGKAVSVQDRETGEELIGYITEIQSETVELDFNHPLAGKDLHFSIKILDLRPAGKEELAHGHVHGAGQAH